MEYDATAGDTGTVIQRTLKDRDTNAALDLTGASVDVLWIKPSDGSLSTGSATVTTSTAGVVTYQFGTGQLEAPEMRLRWRVTDSFGNVITTPEDDTIYVRPAPA